MAQEQAIAYIRVSDQRQVREGNSLVTQERQVREFCASRGYTLVRLFIEEGETAKTDERPVLQQMLAFTSAEEGRIGVLIIPKIDRLARNTADYIQLKHRLNRLSIRLESIGEQLMDSPVGRFTESVLASVAQFDNEIRAERCKGGMIQAVSEGRWVWTPPIGYRTVRINNKGTIEPCPKTAPFITGAFQKLASGGYRPKDVHAWLGEHGVRFCLSHFYRVAHNPAYVGVIQAFGRQERGMPPFVPLVSEATFYRAHRAFLNRTNRKVYQRDNPDFPLRGTVRCRCERYLTAGWAKGKFRRYAYYRCDYCRGVNIGREEVEQGFAELLTYFAKAMVDRRLLERCLIEEWQAQHTKLAETTAQSQEQLAKLRDLRKAIANKNALGVIPDDVAREQIAELTALLVAGESEQPSSVAGAHNIERVVSFGLSFLEDMGGCWLSAGLQLKKRLQRFLLPEGIIYSREDGFGTPENSPFSDLKAFFRDFFSHMVDHPIERPNPAPCVQRSKDMGKEGRLLHLLSKLYEAFGDEGKS